ncbi:MAG: NAD(P)/FAD-dependent oxidoreductase [Candidatus Tectomicrobia bacterium]|nr:NAD(P)/FAD-dependent oxidoreductase [Candidatus Tectomicrobia bacterium]
MAKAPFVVVGNSAAGLNACEALRRCDQATPLILVSEEPTAAYSRVATPYYLCGEIGDATLFFKDDAYYERLGITRRFGERVTAVDPSRHRLTVEDGEELTYDKLLLATGSTPHRPPIAGLDATEVLPHWTLAHAQAIRERSREVSSAAVLGAGFISLLTINAMWKLKPSIRFTVVELQPQVMPNLLDPPAAAMLRRRMEASGITVRTGMEAVAVSQQQGRKLVHLKDGSRLDVEMIVLGAGVRPNIDFLHGSGIACQRGILVDERMQTNQPDVYAAGDCAEGFDFLSGERVVHAIWPTAVEQGRIAGVNMAGGSARYPGSLSMNVLDAFGLTLTSIGIFSERPGVEMYSFTSANGDVYRKIALRDGCLVGMIAAGGPEEARSMGVVQQLIRRRLEIHRWKEALLRNPGIYGRICQESQQGPGLGRPPTATASASRRGPV